MSIVSETWKPVVGYSGVYEVSDKGRIKSLERTFVDTVGRTYTKPERILRCATKSQRYAMVDLYCENRRCNKRVHNIVASAFFGPANGLAVNHKNGNRFDNRVDNLEYITQGENIQHALLDAMVDDYYTSRAAELTYDIGLRA